MEHLPDTTDPVEIALELVDHLDADELDELAGLLRIVASLRRAGQMVARDSGTTTSYSLAGCQLPQRVSTP